MKIVAATQSTVVMVTHDVDEAVLLSERRDDDQRPGGDHRRNT